MSRELPKGWVEVRLEEIASEGPTNGYSPKSGPDAKGTTSLKLSATTGGCFVLNENTVKPLYEEIEPASKYWLKKGDLLIQRANSLEYLGVSAVFPGPDDTYVYPDLMMRVRCGDACETRYLWRHLNCKVSRSYFRDNATGTAGNMPKINGKVVKDTPIRLPPLNEQKRIVAKIDALTEKSREAREALDEVPVLLDQLRQSILAAAFRGDLTKKWREQNPDVEPASVLLERIRKERRKKWEEGELAKFKAKGKVPQDDKWKSKYVEPAPVDTEGLPELPEGWCWASVETTSYVTKLAGFEYTKFVKYRDDGDLPVLKAENAGPWGFKRTEFSRVSSQDVAELTRSQLRGGELLVVFVGAGIGKVATVPSDQPYFLGPNIGMIRILSEHLIPEHLEWFLRSPDGQRVIASFQKSTAQGSLSMGAIRQFPIAVAPLAEQQQIQSILRAALDHCLQLDNEIESVRGKEERLNASILAKAFRGELVPHDPNDEPASVLLERIRKEREGAGLSKKSRAKKKS